VEDLTLFLKVDVRIRAEKSEAILESIHSELNSLLINRMKEKNEGKTFY
jgi:hypothetical protein